MKRYLHIGCGDNILPSPFENLDIRQLPGVQHVSDVYPLDFEDNTFDLVYASHILEHLEKDRTQGVLDEWVRIVAPGGKLRISVPSLERIIEIYGGDGKLENVIGPLMGGQTYKENFHYNMFDNRSLSAMLVEAGLIAVHPWDFRRTEHSAYWDFSQAFTNGVPISLNIEGRKPIGETEKNKCLDDIYDSIKLLLHCNGDADDGYHCQSKTYIELLSLLNKAISDE